MIMTFFEVCPLALLYPSWYNDSMHGFNYQYDIQVRFADFDTQWHVNNARLATFLEQARFSYISQLGLFDSREFVYFPFVVADIHIAFKSPIVIDEPVRVGVRVARIGTKSMVLEYVVVNPSSGDIKATAETVLVGYDNKVGRSIPIKDEWRKTFEDFEGRVFPKPGD